VVAVHGLAGKPAQLHPAGGVMETKVVFAGVASVNVPLVTAVAPVLVTTCVYVMLLPACAGLGETVLVTERFGPVEPTSVVVDAVLFEEIGSVADDDTETVSLITVPFATPVFTFTTIENVPVVPPAMFAFVHTTFPGLPAPGVVHTHPDGAEIETKVEFAGTGAT
jgi:hypothetical protein